MAATSMPSTTKDAYGRRFYHSLQRLNSSSPDSSSANIPSTSKQAYRKKRASPYRRRRRSKRTTKRRVNYSYKRRSNNNRSKSKAIKRFRPVFFHLVRSYRSMLTRLMAKYLRMKNMEPLYVSIDMYAAKKRKRAEDSFVMVDVSRNNELVETTTNVDGSRSSKSTKLRNEINNYPLPRQVKDCAVQSDLLEGVKQEPMERADQNYPIFSNIRMWNAKDDAFSRENQDFVFGQNKTIVTAPMTFMIDENRLCKDNTNFDSRYQGGPSTSKYEPIRSDELKQDSDSESDCDVKYTVTSPSDSQDSL